MHKLFDLLEAMRWERCTEHHRAALLQLFRRKLSSNVATNMRLL